MLVVSGSAMCIKRVADTVVYDPAARHPPNRVGAEGASKRQQLLRPRRQSILCNPGSIACIACKPAKRFVREVRSTNLKKANLHVTRERGRDNSLT